jgi:CSLREA domain-containing protein
VGLLLAYASSPAWAATITVNSLEDTAANDGKCTLRETITSANTDTAFGGCVTGSGDDVINIGVTGTVDLTAELPDLSTNREMVGPGSDQLTVTRPDNAEHFRIFTVTGDTTEVTISGMTISNGNTLEVDDRSGGISNEDNGTLTITNSTISGNKAEDDGAIRNLGTLEVSNATLSGNTSNGTAGGIYNDNEATATVSDSTFSGNSATEGAGIFNSGGGTVTVNNSTFSDNRVNLRGGGIFSNTNLFGETTTSLPTLLREDSGGVFRYRAGVGRGALLRLNQGRGQRLHRLDEVALAGRGSTGGAPGWSVPRGHPAHQRRRRALGGHLRLRGTRG